MMLGMLIYAAVTFSYGLNFDWRLALWSIAFVHAPDIDMIPYLLLKRRLPYGSHWLIGHHFLILLPLYGMIGRHVGQHYGKPASYLAVIAMLDAIAHLIHDSTQPQGLHWLSPFIWKRHALGWFLPREVSKGTWKPILERKTSVLVSLSSEFFERSEPVGLWNIAFWTIAFIAMLIA